LAQAVFGRSDSLAFSCPEPLGSLASTMTDGREGAGV